MTARSLRHSERGRVPARPGPRPAQRSAASGAALGSTGREQTTRWQPPHGTGTLRRRSGARQRWPRGAGLGAPVCRLGSGSGVTKGRWVPWLGRAFSNSRPRGLARERAAARPGWRAARGAGRGQQRATWAAPAPAPLPGVVSLLLQRKKTICSCT